MGATVDSECPDSVPEQAESVGDDQPDDGSVVIESLQDLGFPEGVTKGEVRTWIAEIRNRRDWDRFLSPVDAQWTWQDSAPITIIRHLLMRFAIIDKPKPGEESPRYEARAATPDQLKVLRVLAATRSTIDAVKREQQLLVLELRAREASWDVIAMALGIRRQTAHRKFGNLEHQPHWPGWLNFEVDAARRVAFQRSQDAELSAEQRAEAQQFLDESEWLSDLKTTKQLRRLYR